MARLARFNCLFKCSPQELVVFHIGAEDDKNTFKVHKEVAVFYSQVFRAAFEGDWMKGKTQEYTLDDVSEETFRLMVQWLYGQKFEHCLTQSESDAIRKQPTHTQAQLNEVYEKISNRQGHLINLWVLADRLQIPTLQNFIADELDAIREDWDSVAWEWVHFDYEKTSEKSRLRSLLMMQCMVCLPAEVFREHADEFPKEMLMDYVVVDKLWDESVNPFKYEDEFKKRFHVALPGCDDLHGEMRGKRDLKGNIARRHGGRH